MSRQQVLFKRLNAGSHPSRRNYPCGFAGPAAHTLAGSYLLQQSSDLSPNYLIGATGDYAVAGWFRPDAITGVQQKLLEIGDGSGALTLQLSLFIDGVTAEYVAAIGTTNNAFVLAGTGVTAVAGTWVFFHAGIGKPTTTQVSVVVSANAGSDATNAGGQDTPNVPFRLQIGAGWTGALPNAFFTGRSGLIGVWSRSLGTPDKVALYNAGAGLNYTCLDAGLKAGLLEWWDLYDPAGSATWRANHDGHNLQAVGFVGSQPGVQG